MMAKKGCVEKTKRLLYDQLREGIGMLILTDNDRTKWQLKVLFPEGEEPPLESVCGSLENYGKWETESYQGFPVALIDSSGDIVDQIVLSPMHVIIYVWYSSSDEEEPLFPEFKREMITRRPSGLTYCSYSEIPFPVPYLIAGQL